jgi:4-hydroxyphenylacetate 3-monooxygenase
VKGAVHRRRRSPIGAAKLPDYAVGYIVKMHAPEAHLPNRVAGRRDARDDPLANRFYELDTLMVLDNVLIP